MTHKSKIKELVGRGLNSYHYKALKQMDRIEKKNKEQNHKISILTNELDNDYLTKTEEGSVVSLEHSKEGMVYLDELQGNTMVNYCIDGSKEMTLNGDIDAEGTNVTLTEGVENGLVDVVCEGNTLVNLVSQANIVKNSNDYKHYQINSLIKSNTDYTIITPYSSDVKYRISNYNTSGYLTSWFRGSVKFNTGNNESIRVLYRFIDDNNVVNTNGVLTDEHDKVVLLEGDWTNKEVPKYFEGMKSVGECEDNKIEILSRNKNLWDVEMVKKQNGQKPPYTKNNNIITYFDIGEYGIYVPINVKKSETLRISGTVKNVQNIRIFKASDNFKGTGVYSRDYNGIETEVSPHYICTFPEDGEYYIRIWCKNTGTPILTNFLAEISSTNTTYVEHKSNKKEISLNEPLRGINEDIKDTIMKINNKWYVKRICKEVIINGDTPITGYYNNGVNSDMIVPYYSSKEYERNSYALCDKLPFYKYPSDSHPIGKSESMTVGHGTGGAIFLTLRRSNFANSNLQTYLNNNPIKCIVKLVNPTYEEITDGELITYLDTTHISNNSTIPCNMKIQNSGYNAIIKPSTLYTVALDTNKSGTIGLNLGGAKVTTTNNVATITTPATLVDDSLRLTGKGIKASKVRLLEGDKTNWIPSHFEGMKSCFEDKLQDDGMYKVEISSNNKNLFNGTWVYDERNNRINSGDLIKVKPNTTYTISDNLNYRYQIFEYADNNTHFNSMYPCAGSYTFTTSKRTHYLRFSTYAPSTDVNVKFLLEEGRNVNSYEPNKSNKIQFSSIEPLRKWDKFVFKDGQLMIERYSKKVDLGVEWSNKQQLITGIYRYTLNNIEGIYSMAETICNTVTTVSLSDTHDKVFKYFTNKIWYQTYDDFTLEELREYFTNSNTSLIFKLKEPTYEEIPYDLQKIILEGYENGTLFFDTNIPPTITTTYAGETPIVKSVRLNKTEVLNNTNDINDNIVPYLMDMDYRVICLQLEGGIENISMARLFGGTYEMLQRDILSNRYSKEEYKYRLDAYLSANKITENEYNKLGDMLNE